MTSNAGDQAEGLRKEVPNTNEIANQARSKYFPAQQTEPTIVNHS